MRTYSMDHGEDFFLLVKLPKSNKISKNQMLLEKEGSLEVASFLQVAWKVMTQMLQPL